MQRPAMGLGAYIRFAAMTSFALLSMSADPALSQPDHAGCAKMGDLFKDHAQKAFKAQIHNHDVAAKTVEAKCKVVDEAIVFWEKMNKQLDGIVDYCGEQRTTKQLREAVTDAKAGLTKLSKAQCGKNIPTATSGSCLTPTLGKGIPCDNANDITIVVRNDCDGPRRIRICLQKKTGKMDCASSAFAIPVGEAFSHHSCNVTGKYSFGIK
jgi:hypothetical protein